MDTIESSYFSVITVSLALSQMEIPDGFLPQKTPPQWSTVLIPT